MKAKFRCSTLSGRGEDDDDHDVELPKKLLQFISSIRGVSKDFIFKSRTLHEYYKEMQIVPFMRVLRSCFKFLGFALWWKVLFWQREFIYGKELYVMSYILYLVIFIIGYPLTLWKINFDNLKLFFSISLALTLVIQASDTEGVRKYEFSFFSPAFEYTFLLMTVAPISFATIFPIQMCFIFTIISEVNIKVSNSYWLMQNDSFRKTSFRKMDAFREPWYIVTYDDMLYPAEFLKYKNSAKISYIGMLITSIFAGVYVHFINELRRRTSFMQLGLSVHARQIIGDLREDRMKWVSAIMPSKIIPEYMKYLKAQKEGGSIMSVFSMSYNDVSILFADIVGFTAMASNMSASLIVMRLNDLFYRFDALCCKIGCEKLGTLGDCYYCVSGCPEMRRDHALNCVELGLGMCNIIVEFNEVFKEKLNMRVGCHTGRVNAAVIGRQRFRYDVYSYAVIIANEMESSGRPGRVHISQDTYDHVLHVFRVEPGEDYEIKVEKQLGIQGKIATTNVIKTYFIIDTGVRYHLQSKEWNMTGTRKSTVRKKFTIVDLDKSKDGMANDINVYDEADEENERGSDESPDLDEDSSKEKEDSESNASQKSDATHRTRDTGIFNIDHKDDDWEDHLVGALKNDPQKQADIFANLPVHPITYRFVSGAKEKCFSDQYYEPDVTTISSTTMSPLYDALMTTLFHFFFTLGFLVFHDYKEADRFFILPLTNFVNLLFCIPICLTTFLEENRLGKCLTRHLKRIYSPEMRIIHGIISPNTPFILLMSRFYRNKSLIHLPDFRYTIPFYISAYVSFLPVVLFHSCSSLVHAIATVLKFLILLTLYSFDSAWTNTEQVTNISCESWNGQKLCSECEHMRFLYTDVKDPSSTYPKIISEFSLIFVAIFIICRQNEAIFRLNFFIAQDAKTKQKEAEENSKEAEELLYNIIPKYVIDHIKENTPSGDPSFAGYAVAVSNVGVAFACISNFFSTYYREDYKGGESALALLHKIICIFDDMLLQKQYKDVEKIKTSNDCYLIASGLNVASVGENLDDKAHLYALMLFCFEMMHELDEFNSKWIVGEDRFSLKIGYNIGSVTAGIIGTTKPMFDIWGDTVNMASRLYTTGQSGNIQVTKLTTDRLKERFRFSVRGAVFVKGKGKMTTYIARRPAHVVSESVATEPTPNTDLKHRSLSRMSMIPTKLSKKLGKLNVHH